jgi:hypothetical protein
MRRALVEGCASTDKTLKVYDDASHQLFQDSAQNIDRYAVRALWIGKWFREIVMLPHRQCKALKQGI